MKKLYLFLFISMIAGSLQAQTTDSQPNSTRKLSKKEEKKQRKLKRISVFREQEEGENVFQRDFSVGARLNTDGWTGFLEMGYRKNRKIVTYYQFEFSEKKDPKEDKRQGQGAYQFGFTSRPYIFGKQNNFYPAKFGIGQRYLIGGKANKNGVEVSGIYYGGVSIGLVKPYYISVENKAGQVVDMKYDPDSPDNFLEYTKIQGGAGFGKGWSEVTVIPGLHAKLGMRFDWAHFNEVVSALEVGVNAEMYTKKVPMMITDNNKQLFFNAYLGLQFGKRWNRR